jgi:hypothetical protein
MRFFERRSKLFVNTRYVDNIIMHYMKKCA